MLRSMDTAATRLNMFLGHNLSTRLNQLFEECSYFLDFKQNPWTQSTGNKLLVNFNGDRGGFGMKKIGKRRLLTGVNAINLAIDGLVGSGNNKEHQFDIGIGGGGNDGQGGQGGDRSGGNGGGGSGDANGGDGRMQDWRWRWWVWTCNSFIGKIINTFLYGISNCSNNHVETMVIQAIAKVVLQPLIAEFILNVPPDVLLQLIAGVIPAMMMVMATSMWLSACAISSFSVMFGIMFAAAGLLCLSLLACFIYFGWPWLETMP